MSRIVKTLIIVVALSFNQAAFSEMLDKAPLNTASSNTKHINRSTSRDDSRSQAAKIPADFVFQPGKTIKDRDACQLTEFNGTPAWIQFYWDEGDGSVQYFDPADCGSTPTYPFRINSLDFTLYADYEDPDYSYFDFPVELDVVVYDLTESGDPCDGPGDLLFWFPVVAEEPDFGYPNVGTAEFPWPFCVDGPFFIGVEYTDYRLGNDTLPPCILSDDNTAPVICEQWFYDVSDGNDWQEWDVHFTDPIVGYQYWYVNGETNSSACIIDPDFVIPGLPYTDNGSTVGYTDDYDYDAGGGNSTSPDVVYSYTPAVDEEIYISLCNSEFDTKLYVYENSTSKVVRSNEDYCGDDGYKSKIWYLAITAGNTYYIVVDGWGGEAGNYEITVDYFDHDEYAIDCPPGSSLESEPFGCEFPDTTNGGCNYTPPIFSTIECEETVCGTAGTGYYLGGSYRDTDWYQFTLSEIGSISFIMTAEFPVLFGLIETDPVGSGDCADNQGTISPYLSLYPGETDTLNLLLEAGTYWLFVAPQQRTSSPCDARYVVTMECDCAIKADFDASPRWGVGNVNVAFTNNSVSDNPPTTYYWDFGDLQSAGTENPYHYYTTPGWYDVSLTVTDGCGSVTTTKSKYVFVAENLAVTFDTVGTIINIACINSAADVDHDNNLDLLYYTSAYSYADSLVIAYGLGDGTFEDFAKFDISGSGIGYAFVNNDTLIDVLAASEDSITVMLNNGNRSFTIASFPNNAIDWYDPLIATGYFNDDADVDMVIAPNMVYFGDGEGGFPDSYMMPNSFWSVGVADFNNDGHDDIIGVGSNYTYIFINDGFGNFTSSIIHDNPYQVASEATTYGGLADFNRDGNADFAYVVSAGSNSPENRGYVYIGFGDGAGGINALDSILVYGWPYGIKAVDVNRDNNLDLAVCNQYNHTLELYLGDESGVFDDLIVVEMTPNMFSIAAGDFDRDGNPDFAGGQWVEREPVTLLNNLPDAPVLVDEMTTTGYGEITLDIDNPDEFSISRNFTTVAGADYWRLDIDDDNTLDEAARDYNLQLGEYAIVISPRPGGGDDPSFSIGITIDGSLNATPFLNYTVHNYKSWTGDRSEDSIIFYYTVEEISSIQPPNGVANSINPPTFDWSVLTPFADSFHFQLDRYHDFSSIPLIEDTSGLVATSFTLPFSLGTDSVFYWRYRSYETGAWSAFSRTFAAYMVTGEYVCGDADRNMSINILDVTFLINYLYKGGPAPEPEEAGDANGDGNINILDVTYLINYLYKGGEPPICP